jgi:hypothetical protein
MPLQALLLDCPSGGDKASVCCLCLFPDDVAVRSEQVPEIPHRISPGDQPPFARDDGRDQTTVTVSVRTATYRHRVGTVPSSYAATVPINREKRRLAATA